MTELIRQLEEKYTHKSQQQTEALHKETSEKETQLAEDKQKNEHQQEESRKLKLVIGKLKVTIKGKKTTNVSWKK